MAAPQYCHTRLGRVFRIVRSSEGIDRGGVRYTLRAVPIRLDPSIPGFEASCEVHTDLIRDKIRNHQTIPTPETTFDQLWQQLRLDIDAT